METYKIINQHKEVLEHLENQIPIIEDIIDLLVRTIADGCKFLIAGNGGSAADAQHIAAEFVGRFKLERRAIPAIALTTDSSILTAVGNDYNFRHIFVRQLEALGKKGDVFWALSASGESENIIEAVKTAKALGLVVVGFCGKGESSLQQLSNFAIVAYTDSTARAQELHQLAYHIICEKVEERISDESDKSDRSENLK